MRNYSSTASEKTLTADTPATGTGSDKVNVNDINGFPAVPFTLVLNPDTVKEEIVTVTAISGTQLTVDRAEENTGPAKSHYENEKVRHMITGRDLQEAQDHIANEINPHGIVIANLATKTYADSSASDAVASHTFDTTNVHGITDTSLLATKSYADTAVSTHESDTTNIHGIANTANLLTTTTGTAINSAKIDGRTIYVQATEPTSPVNGDIWFDLP